MGKRKRRAHNRLKTPKPCKYCDKPAKPLIDRKGTRRGFLQTCGSPECLTGARTAKVRAKIRHTEQPPKYSVVLTCPLCNQEFVAHSKRQKYCRPCVPSVRWRHLARRYGIGKPQWEVLLVKQGGHCALCDGDPIMVDHDHETDRVRGLLCGSCNVLISGFDRGADWLKRAFDYIGGV